MNDNIVEVANELDKLLGQTGEVSDILRAVRAILRDSEDTCAPAARTFCEVGAHRADMSVRSLYRAHGTLMRVLRGQGEL